jgi:hypothetical protein
VYVVVVVVVVVYFVIDSVRKLLDAPSYIMGKTLALASNPVGISSKLLPALLTFPYIYPGL